MRLSKINAIFYAGYNQGSLNGDWGAGVLGGTGSGGASADVNGRLNLSGVSYAVRYVDYDGDDNAEIIGAGTIDFKYMPNYSGSPSADQNMILIQGATPNENYNLLSIKHLAAGGLQVAVNDSSGNGIFSNNFGSWSPSLRHLR